ncbi:hypothetical protein F3Y22_tig00111402pilonHSYRG00791 [Hibiscus syriacus]|uniref:Uncharacterized protein n=1 Tax=Hibiscus syriacus TaxID=106335 RepID=A0A6A2YLA5_HIBSY|nr:hypothetical protein F3Y22_tig00111402pilonHSYRG00791 [Hibiscus syriacus]
MAGNVFAMLFVIIAGGYLDFKTGWTRYELPNGYFPFRWMECSLGLQQSSFLILALTHLLALPMRNLKPCTTGEESQTRFAIGYHIIPRHLLWVEHAGFCGDCRSGPLYAMDPDTRISFTFADNGLQWVARVFSAHLKCLMLATGIVAAILAFFMDVSQLAGMCGYTCCIYDVAVSLLILRYAPPYEVPIPSSLQDSIESYMLEHDRDTQVISGEDPEILVGLYVETRMLQLMFPLLKNKKLYHVVPSMKRTEGKSLAGP